MNFKIDDIVIANHDADRYYSVTKCGWIGRVTAVTSSGEIINVISLDEKRGPYSVYSKHFDLYLKSVKLTTQEEDEFLQLIS